MTNLTVIILQKNEFRHIQRCLKRLAPIEPRQIFVVDSPSTDGSDLIAIEMGATVVVHAYPGNQAAQFQWAIENLPIETEWILRLDADEYLTKELISEIRERLPKLGNEIAGVVLKRRHIVGWLNDKWVKRGMYPTRILRLFRRGKGCCDMKLMDEHIIVEGDVVEFEHDFIDHSLISFKEWKAKHREYAKREALSFWQGEKSGGEQSMRKSVYYKLPHYFRAALYWFYRFFVQGAIWDGPKAWRWCWQHAMWYRLLVDYEIGNLHVAYHPGMLKWLCHPCHAWRALLNAFDEVERISYQIAQSGKYE